MRIVIFGLILVLVTACGSEKKSDEWKDLFNGKDLSNFTTWLVDFHHRDPHNVFSVVDRIASDITLERPMTIAEKILTNYLARQMDRATDGAQAGAFLADVKAWLGHFGEIITPGKPSVDTIAQAIAIKIPITNICSEGDFLQVG